MEYMIDSDQSIRSIGILIRGGPRGSAGVLSVVVCVLCVCSLYFFQINSISSSTLYSIIILPSTSISSIIISFKISRGLIVSMPPSLFFIFISIDFISINSLNGLLFLFFFFFFLLFSFYWFCLFTTISQESMKVFLHGDREEQQKTQAMSINIMSPILVDTIISCNMDSMSYKHSFKLLQSIISFIFIEIE